MRASGGGAARRTRGGGGHTAGGGRAERKARDQRRRSARCLEVARATGATFALEGKQGTNAPESMAGGLAGVAVQWRGEESFALVWPGREVSKAQGGEGSRRGARSRGAQSAGRSPTAVGVVAAMRSGSGGTGWCGPKGFREKQRSRAVRVAGRANTGAGGPRGAGRSQPQMAAGQGVRNAVARALRVSSRRGSPDPAKEGLGGQPRALEQTEQKSAAPQRHARRPSGHLQQQLTSATEGGNASKCTPAAAAAKSEASNG